MTTWKAYGRREIKCVKRETVHCRSTQINQKRSHQRKFEKQKWIESSHRPMPQTLPSENTIFRINFNKEKNEFLFSENKKSFGVDDGNGPLCCLCHDKQSEMKRYQRTVLWRPIEMYDCAVVCVCVCASTIIQYFSIQLVWPETRSHLRHLCARAHISTMRARSVHSRSLCVHTPFGVFSVTQLIIIICIHVRRSSTDHHCVWTVDTDTAIRSHQLWPIVQL